MAAALRKVSTVNFFITQLMTVTICLSGCTDFPTNRQLEAWRSEAMTRNAQMVATHSKQTEQLTWELVIQGESKTGKPLRFSWQQLQALATTHVKTSDPNHTSDIKEILDFRGVLVSTLLDKFGKTDSTEVTFIAADAFQATISLTDLRRYPIMIAVERDGKEISRSDGGPLYLVFPHTQYPELQLKYTDKFWPYYVTHMIVGTEPIRVRVGGREFNSADFDNLPQVTLTEPVGYKMGWQSGKVRLQGVRVRDLLASAGVKLPANGSVIVQGTPLIYQDPKKPVRLSYQEINNCDVLLATRWGENQQPIPASLGGPVTLAFPSNCPSASAEQPWVSFVDQLKVTTP